MNLCFPGKSFEEAGEGWEAQVAGYTIRVDRMKLSRHGRPLFEVSTLVAGRLHRRWRDDTLVGALSPCASWMDEMAEEILFALNGSTPK
jgi:hypothetical protein